MYLKIDQIWSAHNVSTRPECLLTEESLTPLMESMRKMGLLHPITVEFQGGKYLLRAGQLRLKAAQYLGWTEIEVEVI